jgi:hypothetical protein
MIKNTTLVLLSTLFFCACKKDKTGVEDLYVVFDYSGPKIDTTSTAADQVIFRNVDGSPAVYVPNYTDNICDKEIFVGTYAIADTQDWHLRLVDPDGDPFHFQTVFNEDHEVIAIQSTMHFIKPAVYDFEVGTLTCEGRQTVIIYN